MSDAGLSLLAVHLSDGALATAWWASGFGGLAVLLAVAMWKVREEEVPRIGVLTAAFFVASSIHLPVMVTSVHLILNGLLGVVPAAEDEARRRRAVVAERLLDIDRQTLG